VIKIGILLYRQAKREKTFSLKAKFLAMLDSGLILSKNDFYSTSKISLKILLYFPEKSI
jgi:hypothetical protein